MNDESNHTPKKPKTRMVARTTYRMDRGRLKRFVRWVRVRVNEEERLASPPTSLRRRAATRRGCRAAGAEKASG